VAGPPSPQNNVSQHSTYTASIFVLILLIITALVVVVVVIILIISLLIIIIIVGIIILNRSNRKNFVSYNKQQRDQQPIKDIQQTRHRFFALKFLRTYPAILILIIFIPVFFAGTLAVTDFFLVIIVVGVLTSE
jgi:hypothetical protein